MAKTSVSALGEAYRKAGPYLSLGVQFTASILICLFGGRWLDGRFGTEPFLMLAGVLLGTVAGFYNFYKAVTRIQTDTTPVESDKPARPGDSA